MAPPLSTRCGHPAHTLRLPPAPHPDLGCAPAKNICEDNQRIQYVLHWLYSSSHACPIVEHFITAFVGDDYPQYYPVDLGAVSFTPEDTVHYQISSNDAENEWDSIFPDGGGFLLLGPQRRAFGLSLFHQMHCLVRIRRAIGARQPSIHAHHCLNYLRQAIICEADSTIEPVVPSPGERTVYAETSRTCKDWEKVYKLVSDNYETTSS